MYVRLFFFRFQWDGSTGIETSDRMQKKDDDDVRGGKECPLRSQEKEFQRCFGDLRDDLKSS